MRVRFAGVVAVTLLGLTFSSYSFSQLRPTPSYMPVADVRPGMRGYGLTVFHGITPERFDVEVIDVLHGFQPDQDLILIRTPHPILNAAHVVAGMSGSPIYLEGRLIGAYAYGWPFGSEPVAGVTPIHNMLRDLERVPRVLGAVQGALRVGVSGTTGHARVQQRRGALNHASLERVATPILSAGLPASALAFLGEQLGEFGFDVVQAGGTGTGTVAPTAPRFVDGSAVGVTLIRGDISMQAVGTITHVRGSRAIGFGHPMLESGQTSIPTSLARVVHILASTQRSFKLAESVAALGALVEDRQASIVVDSNATASLIPVSIALTGTGLDAATRRAWNLEVASHPALSPVLIVTALVSAVKSSVGDSADVTFDATTRVWVSGRQQPVELFDRGFSHTGAFQPGALGQLRLFPVLEAIYNNPFEEARATRVSIAIDVHFARQTAEIVDASIDDLRVHAGDDLPLHVVLRQFAGPEQHIDTHVRIPGDARGALQITIQPGSDVELERVEPRSLDDIIANIRRDYLSSSLVVSCQGRARGMRVAGHVVRSLPPSLVDALQASSEGERTRAIQTFDRTEIRTPHVLSGSVRLEVQVSEY